MNTQAKFFLMLLLLSVVLGVGIIIPGFLKIREFEFNEAESYLRDRNGLLQQDLARSKKVLDDAGVADIDSYVTASKNKLLERYRGSEPDARISTFILSEDGQFLLAQQGRNNLELSPDFQTIDIESSAEMVEYKQANDTWRMVSHRDEDWAWTVATAISDLEIYRESNAYLKFVLFVSSGVLLAVLLGYMTLTRHIRRRFQNIIEGIKQYKLGQQAPAVDSYETDEIGLLQHHIYTMMDSISEE
ncbi:MAG: hypothetical protein P8Y12_01305, partial [Gammaproteobacteria bacterium]